MAPALIIYASGAALLAAAAVAPAVYASDGEGGHSGSSLLTVTSAGKTWTDAAGDAAARPTGSLTQPHFAIAPDLLDLSLRFWDPASPADPFAGAAGTFQSSHVMRFDMTVAGLVNPPGPLGLGGYPWDPDRFGDRPLNGFIEFDVDGQKNSGGELEPIARTRFLANVGRFGELPDNSFGDRAARSAADYDGVFATAPPIEESGAEFTLVLCGCFDPTLISQTGNMDGHLDPGETMVVRGRFFERIQAVAPFSGVFGGSDFGLYDPDVDLRFQHDPQTDTTTVSFVFPLDHTGAAILTGEPLQPMDFAVFNHTSVAEALSDLIFAAEGLLGPVTDPAVFELIREWQGADPAGDTLDLRKWDVHALLGASYMSPGAGALYVWSDVGFDTVFGNMVADSVITQADLDAITNAIATMDGGPDDADGAINGAVVITNFGPNFNLHDLTGDGVIDAADLAAFPPFSADLNGDGRVNGADITLILNAWGSVSNPADLNGDGVVNGADITAVLSNWTG
ncbi:MAG: hypothetical protein D6693_02395 [Planctomycetota bacterium]|nr:MAG: hypothetical protein D6693_02395 [Planctomycetota bacterium]